MAKSMTVNQLHKALGKLIEKGNGRRYVCIDKPSFHHNCESDGVVILQIETCSLESVLNWNNDTDDYCNKDGSERWRQTVVLRGDNGVPFKRIIDPESVEEYIRGLAFSGTHGDDVYTLVVGNIRGFASWLRERVS